MMDLADRIVFGWITGTDQTQRAAAGLYCELHVRQAQSGSRVDSGDLIARRLGVSTAAADDARRLLAEHSVIREIRGIYYVS